MADENPQDLDLTQTNPTFSDLRQQMTADLQQSAAKTYDPYRRGAAEGFNAAPSGSGGLNFERYYNKNAYAELGFNPYINNEELYNTNTSGWDDFVTASQQWGNLFGLGFSSMWNGKTDYRESQEYGRYSNIGSSTKGGFSGMMTNAYLNSGYTIGLISEIAVEEAALALATAATGGGAAPVLGARTSANASRLYRGMNSATNLAGKMNSVLSRIKDLKNIGKAQTLYGAAKKGFQAVNPLRGTTEFLTTVGRQYKRGAGGKIEKLSDIAKLQRGFGTFYRDIREINLAIDEAQLESGFINTKVREELIKDHIKKYDKHPDATVMGKINETAVQASKNTLLNNTVLIYGTNRIAFGNTFNKWMPRALQKTSKKITGGRVVKDFKTGKTQFIKHGGMLGYKTFVNEAKHAFKKQTLKRAPWATAKFLGKYTRANFGEGMQEYFQEVIQHAEFNMAKDRYYGALAGSVYHNSFFNEDYMEHYSKSFDHFMGAEGAEIFGSGFMMGTFVGPFSRGSHYATSQLKKGGKYVFNRKAYDQEQSYQKQRQADIEKDVVRFNEMTDTKKDFLKNYIDHLMKQSSYKEGMDKATEENDQKNFVDMKDASLVDQIIFAESMDSYDLILEKLKDMGKMSEEDLRNAFGEQVDEKSDFISDFKDSYDKVISRAKSIHTMSQQFDTLFPEPPTYGSEDVDIETGIQQRDIIKARRKAKATAILNQHSLVRTMERMEKIQKEIYGPKAPFWKKDKTPPSSELDKIYSKDQIDNEIFLLREEIKSLKGFDKLDPAQRKDLKYKEQIKDTLESLSVAIRNYSKSLTAADMLEFQRKRAQPEDLAMGHAANYSRGNTQWSGKIVGETTSKKGKPQWIIEKEDGSTSTILKDSVGLQKEVITEEEAADVTTEPIKVLKKYFKQYLETVGNHHDNKLDETKLEDSFQGFKDFYSLAEDEKNLSQMVSFLMDPEGHYAFVERYNELIKTENANQEETLRDQLKLFQEAKENQELVEMLTKQYGVFIHQDDLRELTENDLVPDIFYDIETAIQLRTDTEKHASITSAIENWLKDTGRTEEPTEAPVEEPTKELTTTKEVVPTKKITSSTPFEEWPESLQEAARISMRDFNSLMEERAREYGEKVKIFEDPAEFVKPGRPGQSRLATKLAEYNQTVQAKKEIEQITKPKPTPVAEEEIITEEGEIIDPGEVFEGPVARPELEFPTAVLPLDEDVKNRVMTGEAKSVSIPLGQSYIKDVLKALRKAGAISRTEGLTPGKILTFQMEVTDPSGAKMDLKFAYKGEVTLAQAGGLLQMIQELGLPVGEEGLFPVVLDEVTYQANSKDQQLWLQGVNPASTQRLFGVVAVPAVDVEMFEDPSKWLGEIKSRFEGSQLTEDLEILKAKIIAENTNRLMEGQVSAMVEDIQEMYEAAVARLKDGIPVGNLTEVFIPGDVYNLRNFGDAVVESVSDTEVVFVVGDQTKTISAADINKQVLRKVTEISEEIAEEISETMTPEEQEINDTNQKSVEDFSKDGPAINSILDNADKKSEEDINKDFFNNLGKCE